MLQLAINLFFSSLTLILIAQILPGFELEHFRETVLACLMIGFVNFLILPLLAILKATINIVSIFVFSFIINILILNVATGLVDEYDISSWSAAVLGALALSLVQLLSSLLTEDRRKLIG